MPGGTRRSVTSKDSLIVRSPLYSTTYPISSDHSVAIVALGETIRRFTQAGRFRQAADREKEIAQIYIREQNDVRNACESYIRAGEWYQQEDATA